MTQLPYGSNYRLLMLSASLKKAERTYTRDETGKFGEEGSGGGGDKEKPKAEAKPKAKAKATPEEKAEAKSEEANANRAEVGEALADVGMDEDSLDDLADFAAGGEGKTTAYEKAGLVSVDKDGVKSLTPEGKKLLAAANKGDVEGAKRALETAGKRVAGREARAAEAQGKADAKAKVKADKEKTKADAKAKAEAKKPKGGGGGGGGAKAKPEKEAPEDKDKAKAEAKTKATDEAAAKAGVKPEELSGMRVAAEGGKPSPEAVQSLTRAGLMEDTPDGPQLTSAGRSALSALERGDARGAVAAQQAGKGKQRQTAERSKAKADKDKVEGEKDKVKADKEKGKADLADAKARREREMLKPFMQEKKMLKRAGMPYGFDPYSLAKHAKHNQKAHGRRKRSGISSSGAPASTAAATPTTAKPKRTPKAKPATGGGAATKPQTEEQPQAVTEQPKTRSGVTISGDAAAYAQFKADKERARKERADIKQRQQAVAARATAATRASLDRDAEETKARIAAIKARLAELKRKP